MYCIIDFKHKPSVLYLFQHKPSVLYLFQHKPSVLYLFQHKPSVLYLFKHKPSVLYLFQHKPSVLYLFKHKPSVLYLFQHKPSVLQRRTIQDWHGMLSASRSCYYNDVSIPVTTSDMWSQTLWPRADQHQGKTIMTFSTR